MTFHDSNQTVTQVATRKLVSDEALEYIEITLFMVVCGTVAVCGCLANLANMIVFVRQGSQESSNISLFSLSVADFMVCLATIGTAATSALNMTQRNVNVDFGAVNYIIASVRQCFNDLSMFTIVFLSLERCLCVVKPLTFKHIISRRRTLIFLSIIYTEAVVFQGLTLYGNRLFWQFNSKTNSTRLQLQTLPLGKAVLSIYEIVNGVSLPLSAMILVTVASCVMVYGLMEASKFRMKIISAEARTTNDKVTYSLSSKDVRVVKMVAYVSVMFVVCYLPFLFIICIRSYLPDVGFMKAQHNFNETFFAIIYASVTINSASNILVYFRVSSKYRDVFFSTFWGCAPISRVQRDSELNKSHCS